MPPGQRVMEVMGVMMVMLRRKMRTGRAVRLHQVVVAAAVAVAIAPGTGWRPRGVVQEDGVTGVSGGGAARQRGVLGAPAAVGGAGPQWQGGVLPPTQCTHGGVHSAGAANRGLPVQTLVCTLLGGRERESGG